jgi:hypothetical protein
VDAKINEADWDDTAFDESRLYNPRFGNPYRGARVHDIPCIGDNPDESPSSESEEDEEPRDVLASGAGTGDLIVTTLPKVIPGTVTTPETADKCRSCGRVPCFLSGDAADESTTILGTAMEEDGSYNNSEIRFALYREMSSQFNG